MSDSRDPQAATNPIERRRFLQAAGIASLAPLLGCATTASPSENGSPAAIAVASAAAAAAAADRPATPDGFGAAGQAFDALLASLARIRNEQLTTAFEITSREDVAEGHRHLLHVLEQALLVELEAQPTHPLPQHQVSPVRKSNGDNADAIYYSTPLAPGRTYRLRSNQAGAVYSSITLEAGGERGGYAARIAGVLNDAGYDYVNRRISLNRRQIEFEADGSYRIVVAHRDPGVPNWLDCEGRTTGQIYWRIMLPEADVPTPRAEVVKLTSLRD